MEIWRKDSSGKEIKLFGRIGKHLVSSWNREETTVAGERHKRGKQRDIREVIWERIEQNPGQCKNYVE